MLRNTYRKPGISCRMDTIENRRGGRAYIVAAEDANDLAASIKLHEQPLVEVLNAG